MSTVHGKDAAFYLDDSGGTQRNLTSLLDSVETSWDREVNETTTFGNNSRRYTGGLLTNTFSTSGKWDNGGTATPDQWLKGLQDAAGTITATFHLFPNGSASGRPYFTGECYVTKYGVSVPYDDVVTFSADFTVDGAVTRGTA